MVLGEECANPKPYPDPYLEGLKAFNVKPEETIVCEDSPSGSHSSTSKEHGLAGPTWKACASLCKYGKAVGGNGCATCSRQTYCGCAVG